MLSCHVVLEFFEIDQELLSLGTQGNYRKNCHAHSLYVKEFLRVTTETNHWYVIIFMIS